MRKLFAITVIIAVFLALALSLSACDGSSNNARSSSTDPRTEQAITAEGWWHRKPPKYVPGFAAVTLTRQYSGKRSPIQFITSNKGVSLKLPNPQARVVNAEVIYGSNPEPPNEQRYPRWDGKGSVPLENSQHVKLREIYVAIYDPRFPKFTAITIGVVDMHGEEGAQG